MLQLQNYVIRCEAICQFRPILLFNFLTGSSSLWFPVKHFPTLEMPWTFYKQSIKHTFYSQIVVYVIYCKFQAGRMGPQLTGGLICIPHGGSLLGHIWVLTYRLGNTDFYNLNEHAVERSLLLATLKRLSSYLKKRQTIKGKNGQERNL